MARRIINECDLTKKEYDPADTVQITIKAGKKKGRTYELSPEAAEVLERALVSREAHMIVPQGYSPDYIEEEKKSPPQDEDDENEILIREKEVRNHDDWPETIETSSSDECSHPNKSRPTLRTVEGKKDLYRKCNDCGEFLIYSTLKEKDAFMRAKPGKGINVGTHASEDRKRE